MMTANVIVINTLRSEEWVDQRHTLTHRNGVDLSTAQSISIRPASLMTSFFIWRGPYIIAIVMLSFRPLQGLCRYAFKR